MRSHRRLTLPLPVLLLFACGFPVAAETKRPNFVFFLVDDLGWADLSCYGSDFYETPNIDRLAASGVKFTHAYTACPVCSPTRASILTGRHPVRLEITDWIPGTRRNLMQNPKFLHVEDRHNLALEEVTFAEVLKGEGYQTFFAGKWHLGDRGHWPTDQGFDVNIGGNDKGSPPGGYYAPWDNPTLKAKREGEYLTERLTEEALALLDNRDTQNPFLLYLCYYNVHTPITPYEKRIDHYRQKAEAMFDSETPTKVERDGISRTRQDNAEYASMIAAVDDSVGAVLQKLDELKLDENTIVCFFSDNGGLCTNRRRAGPTSNLPLRSGKGWLYEGGVRVPLIVRAPGIATPGSETNTPVVSTDFFPTILELAGLSSQPELPADGQSFVPLLKQEQDAVNRTLYWHYPHYHGSTWTPGASIRDGDWKLIEFYEYDTAELFNLAEDPGETNDLSHENPAKAAELREKLLAWQKEMHAQMPQPNPDYQPVAR